jgi:SAM-dependent methyltransferase
MVIGVDITDGMLAEARKMAAAEKLSNVRFESGDADNLQYGDESFRLVTCRLAVHHFLNPQRPLAEMKRVVRRGGHVVVVDILGPDDQATHDRYDHFERLRDPTHTRTQTKLELQRLLMDAGLESHGQPVTRLFPVKLTEWMAFTKTPPAHQQEILAAVQAELAGGPPTGMRPYLVDDHLFFKHEYAVAIATRSLSRAAP